MKIIDISQPLGTGTAVWPGDQPFELSWTMQQERGDSVNVAALKLSVHTGTHADGPYHVMDNGTHPAGLPLDAFIGRAVVVDARGRAQLNEQAVDDVDLSSAERILFRTRAHADPGVFPREFLSPTTGLARLLAQHGVRLIGSDAPSMDAIHSRTVDAHRVLFGAGIAILENLDLSNVEPGVYTLIALPLKLVEADSSPVRAVLIEGSLGS